MSNQMPKFEQMSAEEIDSVYSYAMALYDGRIKPPEGVVIGDSVEATIKNMYDLFVLFTVPDYESVHRVLTQFASIDARLVEVALKYTRRSTVN